MSNKEIEKNINDLNKEFNKIISSGVFIYEENWNRFNELIKELELSKVAFSLLSNEYYNHDNSPRFNLLLEQFSKNKKLDSEKEFIVKYQKFEIAGSVKNSVDEIFINLRNNQYLENDFTEEVFVIINPSLIKIKQFKNRAFNLYFQSIIGFYI